MDPENGRKIKEGYCIFCRTEVLQFSYQDAGSLFAISLVEYIVLTLHFQRYAAWNFEKVLDD